MRAFVVAACLVALCAAVSTSEMEATMSSVSDSMDVPFNKILSIKQMMDDQFLVSKELGESEEMSVSQMQAKSDREAAGLLMKASHMLDNIVSKQEGLKKEMMDKALLGEGMELAQEFPKIEVTNPKDIARTIRNVVSYLGNVAKDGKELSQAQISQARKWYLDTTAVVLGRYAYEDQKADLGKQKAAKFSFDALRDRAENVKQKMDQVDAEDHLHKLHADKMMNHDGLDIVKLLTKTGRLSNFLAEIEDSVRSKQTNQAGEVTDVHKLKSREEAISKAINQVLASVELGDPITQTATKEAVPANKDASPKEKKLLGKLMNAANKEDKARIVEQAGKVAERKISKVMSDATASIEKKKAEIQKIEKKENKQDDSVRRLMTAPLSEAKKQYAEAKAKDTDVVHVITNAHPMIEVRDDMTIPIETLHSSVNNQVGKNLDSILKLMEKRKSEKKMMNLKDYKEVNSHLRKLSAHLMQKYADKDAEQDKPYMLRMPLAKALTLPLKDVAWFKDPAALKAQEKRDADEIKNKGITPIHQLLEVPVAEAKKRYAKSPAAIYTHKKAEEKKTQSKQDDSIKKLLTVKVTDAKKAYETAKKKKKVVKKTVKKAPVKKVEAPPAPAKRDPVTSFVWHTLGKTGVTRIAKKESLSSLLQHGVAMAGGLLKFAMPGN